MINVLLVDDHELVRTGIEGILNAVEDISVIGVAKSGEDAVKATIELTVDIVLMDVNMPGIGGLEACKRILQINPKIKIIALSVHNDGPIPHKLMKLGVMGFISKGSSADEMILAIRQVMNGESYLCREVINNPNFQALPGSNKSPFSKLSQRETEVVTLILQGKTIQEMAQMLAVKDKTVNTFRYRLYAKLKIKNDVELTRLAVKFCHIDTGLI
jgi:two-component system, NarL family, invasion response regulator UvrY